jgi:uncharacterized metal-binding protein YceD (DUF177 family)
LRRLETYYISYKGLAVGEYYYDFELRKSFFEVYENQEIADANLAIGVVFIKKETHIEITFDISGVLYLTCDRCLEIFENDFTVSQTIYVKFGDAYAEEDENLYVLPEADNDIDLSQFINELIVVNIPMRKVHPEDENGNPTCPNDVLKYINNIKNEGSISDPRWNELNKLKDGTS